MTLTADRLAEALAALAAIKAEALRRGDEGEAEADRLYVLALNAEQSIAALIEATSRTGYWGRTKSPEIESVRRDGFAAAIPTAASRLSASCLQIEGAETIASVARLDSAGEAVLTTPINASAA